MLHALLLILGTSLVALAALRLARRAASSRREAERLRTALAEQSDAKQRLEARTTQLAAALETAECGDRAKSQFLATMSHELRTQLNAINGFAQFLNSNLCGSLSAKQRGYVEDIHRAGGHLLALVSDVHDLSLVDARQLVLDDDVVNLGDLIAGLIAGLSPRAAEVGVALRSTIAPGLPAVRADARRLRQILLDLLSNALKFTPKGGIITAAAEQRGADVALIVNDTGVGMAPERLSVALARYGQGENRFDRRQDGTGLSLPLAKRLVELHGGTLAIDSAPGSGTTVTVLLPGDRVVTRSAAA
jgi:signal transduction histidine kinase